MSYLQALNAGLLDSADSVTPTLDVVLGYGNTSSKSISLTGTGSLTVGGPIYAGGTTGLTLSGGSNATINMFDQMVNVIKPPKSTYTTLSTITDPTMTGYVLSNFTSDTISLSLNDGSYHTLYTVDDIIPAGVYYLCVSISYTTTDTFAITNLTRFALANGSTLTAGIACNGGSSSNNDVINFSCPFISDGILNTKINLLYNTLVSNLTVELIEYNLIRLA